MGLMQKQQKIANPDGDVFAPAKRFRHARAEGAVSYVVIDTHAGPTAASPYGAAVWYSDAASAIDAVDELRALKEQAIAKAAELNGEG